MYGPNREVSVHASLSGRHALSGRLAHLRYSSALCAFSALLLAQVSHDSTPSWFSNDAIKPPTQHGFDMTKHPSSHRRWKYTNMVYVTVDNPVLRVVPASTILDLSVSDNVAYLDKRRYRRACRKLGVRV